jgi:hypothetical protein
MVYAAIVLSPLAPLALKSPTLAHAITGECAGDCDICGCAPERRASHTCCCWMKKLREQEALSRGTSSCLPAEHEAGCCSAAKESSKHTCCGEGPAKTKRMNTPSTIYRCSPCGKGKLALLWGTETYQHLPYLFSGNLSDTSLAYAIPQPDYLRSRHQEPPDPPPKHILPA